MSRKRATRRKVSVHDDEIAVDLVDELREHEYPF